MGLLDRLFGKIKAPATPNPIRETLFGDKPLDQWPRDGVDAHDFPWSAFAAARGHLAVGNRDAATACWRQVSETADLEPRHYLQAWHFLRQHGQKPPTDVGKQVLGVVVEVGMPQGLDLLAAYQDHSARYYNYSGAAVIWEHPDASLDEAIDKLLSISAQIVAQIVPWEEPRLPAPQPGGVRLSFLTPSGPHFGQGPFDVLSKDPHAGLVLQLASILMQAMIAKTKVQPSSGANTG